MCTWAAIGAAGALPLPATGRRNQRLDAMPLIATPDGAGRQSHNPAFRAVLINLVTPATREHERAADRDCTARARLSGLSFRRVVREQGILIRTPAIAAWNPAIY